MNHLLRKIFFWDEPPNHFRTMRLKCTMDEGD